MGEILSFYLSPGNVDDRAVIESVNDFMKTYAQVRHTRHRSFVNFMVNLLAALAAAVPGDRFLWPFQAGWLPHVSL